MEILSTSKLFWRNSLVDWSLVPIHLCHPSISFDRPTQSPLHLHPHRLCLWHSDSRKVGGQEMASIGCLQSIQTDHQSTDSLATKSVCHAAIDIKHWCFHERHSPIVHKPVKRRKYRTEGDAVIGPSSPSLI